MSSLEDRYNTHELPRDLRELFISEEAVAVYLTENCKILLKLQSKNKRLMLFNTILQMIFVNDKATLKLDEGYLKDLDKLFSSTIDMLSSFFSILNEDNYMELARLIDFITMLYTDKYNVICSKKRALNYSKKGICFVDNRYDDVTDNVEEFFYKEIEKYKKEKVLEKTMKI